MRFTHQLIYIVTFSINFHHTCTLHDIVPGGLCMRPPQNVRLSMHKHIYIHYNVINYNISIHTCCKTLTNLQSYMYCEGWNNTKQYNINDTQILKLHTLFKQLVKVTKHYYRV